MMDEAHVQDYAVAEIPALLEREFGETRHLRTIRWHMQPRANGGGGNLIPDRYDLAGHPRFTLETIKAWHLAVKASKPGRKPKPKP